MSAEAVGRQMPEVVTLDDLTVMNDEDDFHRATMPLAWVLNTTPAEHDLA